MVEYVGDGGPVHGAYTVKLVEKFPSVKRMTM